METNADAAPAADGRDAPGPGGAARPTGGLYLKASVFLVGAGVMSAEMAAPRLLAPFFGATQLVWTNIIGTVLAALTAGAFVGGRLADRWPAEKTYARATALGGCLLALAPFAARPLLAAASSALATRSVATFLLSLAAVCLFFAPPVFVLGMVSPWAVRLAGAGRADLGRVAGVLSGLGAAGSIFGTFFSSLVMLPLLGTRNTLLVTAGVVAATGAWRAFDVGWTRGAGVVAAGALALAPGARIKADPGQVYEAESFYQYIQVRRSAGGATRLYLNEGQGEHSLMPAAGHVTGQYYDSISILAPTTTRPGGRLRVLVLGLAGGTMAWQLEHFFGRTHELEIDGVEIDPGVLEAGRRFFDLDAARSLRVHVADARPFLGRARGPYDLVVADAYRQPYIPFQMATREFYGAVSGVLAAEGIFAANLVVDREDAGLADAFTATMRSVFPHVARFVASRYGARLRNSMCLGSKARLSPPAPAAVPGELRADVLRRMLTTWEEPLARPGAVVLTDDRAPIEAFVHRMIFAAATRGRR